LNLFSIRYASRLDFDIDVDAEVLAYGIPKNLLQPIIENYFVHGIHLDRDDNAFSIRGYARDGDIVFEFEDNGRGMTEARLQEIRRRLEEDDAKGTESYGLTNVNERIRLVYGQGYGLRFESGERGRTKVEARIRALTCEQLEGNLRVRG
jgi:two-component system sensor histidine kinase YesM